MSRKCFLVSTALTRLSLTTSFTGGYKCGQSSLGWEGSQPQVVTSMVQPAEQAVLGLSWKRLCISPVKGREQEQPWGGERERKKDKSLVNAGVMSSSILFHSPLALVISMCDITMQRKSEKAKFCRLWFLFHAFSRKLILPWLVVVCTYLSSSIA